ncbi:hypothetical protein [Aureimonas sp. Leaf324]|uniref:hypothetical protein n=1 Tax=Aureimonas sp. Leaf324 TaxID=1736336 RepID=UPI0006FCE5EE|nr:hypothetical protein [Aureimonas sp. Leaf324]KQQ85088.1 hypothetical protein ASF65_19930 [Aureimonas sp. Leaf324]
MSDLFGDEMNWLDDTPSADPAIQVEYKAALGGFLVQFNALENMLADILEMSFRSLKRRDLYRGNEPFEKRLMTLELVGLALPRMHTPNFPELRSLADERNKLAYGHFDQNPYSGEYRVISRGGVARELSAAQIRALEDRALVAWNDVRSCLAFHWFDPDGSMLRRDE